MHQISGRPLLDHRIGYDVQATSHLPMCSTAHKLVSSAGRYSNTTAHLFGSIGTSY